MIIKSEESSCNLNLLISLQHFWLDSLDISLNSLCFLGEKQTHLYFSHSGWILKLKYFVVLFLAVFILVTSYTLSKQCFSKMKEIFFFFEARYKKMQDNTAYLQWKLFKFNFFIVFACIAKRLCSCHYFLLSFLYIKCGWTGKNRFYIFVLLLL